MKLLLKTETDIFLSEYQKMKKDCFPYHYLLYLVNNSFYVIAIASLLGIYVQTSLIDTIIIHIFLISISGIIIKIRWKFLLNREYQRLLSVYQQDTHLVIYFYQNQLKCKRKYATTTIKYNSIQKIIETKTHFYLFFSTEFLPILKANCGSENFSFFRNINQNAYEDRSHKNKEKTNIIISSPYKKEQKVEKKTKACQILLIISIASCICGIITLFIYTATLNEHPLIMIHYSWILLCFIPISFLCALLHIILVKKVNMYFVIHVFILSCTLLLGTFFIWSPLYKNKTNVKEYHSIFQYVPSHGIFLEYKANLADTTTNIFKFKNKNEIEIFEKNISDNKNWILKNQIDNSLQKLFTAEMMMGTSHDYYIFYIQELDKYNTIPTHEGTYHICAAMYTPQNTTLLIEKYILKI